MNNLQGVVISGNIEPKPCNNLLHHIINNNLGTILDSVGWTKSSKPIGHDQRAQMSCSAP